jgi:hypothetical protein
MSRALPGITNGEIPPAGERFPQNRRTRPGSAPTCPNTSRGSHRPATVPDVGRPIAGSRPEQQHRGTPAVKRSCATSPRHRTSEPLDERLLVNDLPFNLRVSGRFRIRYFPSSRAVDRRRVAARLRRPSRERAWHRTAMLESYAQSAAGS